MSYTIHQRRILFIVVSQYSLNSYARRINQCNINVILSQYYTMSMNRSFGSINVINDRVCRKLFFNATYDSSRVVSVLLAS